MLYKVACDTIFTEQEKGTEYMTESYVCIDLETTGLDPKRNKIIEIGVVRVLNNKIVEEWESFVNPNELLEERITELTGIRAP